MIEQSYGGILVRSWDPSQTGWHCFANGKYVLYCHLGQSKNLNFPVNLSHFTIYSPPNNIWIGEGKKAECSENEVWYAGVIQNEKIERQFLEKRIDSYPVEKPWGAEFWLSNEHPLYCFKKIRLNKGQRTSLQFHHEKKETNVFISGTMRLHYQISGDAKNGAPSLEKIASVELKGPITMDINPYTVHRIEAITELEFLEISTPQVHDVIRISDDTKRANGRIESEHRK